MPVTPGQCRAARALIGWSQELLASRSKVAKATIANFELGKRVPYDRTLDNISAALEAAGVEFTNGDQPGVRLKKGDGVTRATWDPPPKR
jgi:transcriptional regulator with XRE-family HTH domain